MASFSVNCWFYFYNFARSVMQKKPSLSLHERYQGNVTGKLQKSNKIFNFEIKLMKNIYLVILIFSTNIFAQQPGLGVTDVDGNYYQSIILGSQEWMQSNLKVSKYNNNDPIPTTPFYTYDYSNETEPKYQWLTIENIAFGRHYTWYVAIDSRGLCPEGWRVPTANDWEELFTQLDGILVAGGKMKEAGFSNWLPPNTGATNESTLTAIPAGYHSIYGGDTAIYYNAFFTSATEYSEDSNWLMHLSWIDNRAYTNGVAPTKQLGLSCRCIKNTELSNIDIQNNLLRIYPNPIKNNILHIETQNNSTKEIVIYNSLGQQINKQTILGDVLNLDLKSGLYIIEIIQDRITYRKKIIIQ